MDLAAVTPAGRYDLAAITEAAGIDEPFDLVVVKTDAAGNNLPENLGAFGCPTVLLFQGTNEPEGALCTTVAYALETGFDYIVATDTRQHLHWFRAAGFSQTAWLPGLIASGASRPWHEVRQRRIACATSPDDAHPQRARLVEAMRQAGLPLTARSAGEPMAELDAASCLAFHASLNGELGRRVLEVVATGGCLLTDRLAPAAGLGELFEPSAEILTYGSADELLELAERYLANPAAALAIARRGHARWAATCRPEHQAEALLRWILDGVIHTPFAATGDRRSPTSETSFARLRERLTLYERVQELHREHASLRVLLTPEISDVVFEDLSDLPRLEVARIANGDVRPGRPKIVARAEADAQSWDLLVEAGGAAEPPTTVHSGSRVEVHALREPAAVYAAVA